jgi:imidazolonepropionase-like amidohydrolase
MISGGVVSLTDSAEDSQFSAAELSVMVQEAAARSTYVTGHAMNSKSIQVGLQAGLACFEHGTYLDGDTARAMAEAGAALVPTLAVCRLMTTEWQRWGLPEDVVPRMAGVESAEAESAQLADKVGVLIGSGSDLLGPEQNRRGLELTLKAQILGSMAAIVAATSSMAQIMRIADRLGSLAPGKLADLIAVDGDPLTEPDLFDQPERVKVVIKNGVVEKDTR